MSSFSPRTEEPSTTDTNWINTNYGGLNPALVIDAGTGSVIPNCVGYTWGRWREILGYYHLLYLGNADGCYGHTSDGYKRGQNPRLGAVICFSGGLQSGHTAVVEEIIDATHIRTSNSAYGGSRFWTEIVEKIGGVWTRPYSGYSFQGFIYLPTTLNIPIWLLFKFKRRKS